MRPTLRQLQYLVAISETGRFGEAARRLNVSQPSLSAQVAAMEAELGVVLFERTSTGALLTPKGAELVRRAKEILRDVEDFNHAARQEAGPLSGLIRLGVLPTIGPYLLPAATRHLHARFPDLRFSVHEQRTSDLELRLREGWFDTVISTANDPGGVVAMPLFEEQLWICVAPDDPLAAASGPVKLSDLKGRQMLSLQHWAHLNLKVEMIAAEAGARINAEYAGTSLDSLRQMAEMGAGVAVLPGLYALSEMRRDPHLIIRKINHPVASRKISLIRRTSSPMAHDLETLAGILCEVAAKLLDESCLASRTKRKTVARTRRS
jgi:LysR family transcriptional regulator, hydrogen peroxide-inducible genes activator